MDIQRRQVATMAAAIEDDTRSTTVADTALVHQVVGAAMDPAAAWAEDGDAAVLWLKTAEVT
ncbi:hypothetical protein LPJ56_000103 [Coemansia sp. RSA 2599]|nr:hypothetical protein LPJ56_000103 [Coemansia sp. RSA 2599]